MPNLNPIVLNDGQATPVAHTFDPQGPDDNQVYRLLDRSSGIATGFPSLTLSLKHPKVTQANLANTRIVRAAVGVKVPVIDTVNGTNAVLYTLSGKVEFTLPERCTPAERADLCAYISNALSHADIQSMITDLEGFY